MGPKRRAMHVTEKVCKVTGIVKTGTEMRADREIMATDKAIFTKFWVSGFIMIFYYREGMLSTVRIIIYIIY